MTTNTTSALFSGAALALAGAAGISGCSTYKPGGSGFADDAHTYFSTALEPKTVTVVDTRTGQTVWTYEVPANRQLTLRFYPDQSPDTPNTPDKLMWQEFTIGTESGNLNNEMLVPDSRNRRLDWYIRPTADVTRAQGKTGAGS